MEGKPETKGGLQQESYTGLQLHFLNRLVHLLQLRYGDGGCLSPETQRLLDRAIYSTYCDCLDLDVGKEAQRLIRRYYHTSKGEPATN